MRMLRGREEPGASLSLYFISCIVIYRQILRHKYCDLFLQVNFTHPLEEVNSYLQLRSRKQAFGNAKPGCELLEINTWRGGYLVLKISLRKFAPADLLVRMRAAETIFHGWCLH